MKKDAKQPGGGARSRLLRDCAVGLRTLWRRKLWLGRHRAGMDRRLRIKTADAIPARFGCVHAVCPFPIRREQHAGRSFYEQLIGASVRIGTFTYAANSSLEWQLSETT